MRAIQRIEDLLTIVLFLSALATPAAIGSFKKHAPISSTENRALAKAPVWGWSATAMKAWPRDFETWYDDHFSLRDEFLSRYHRLRFEVYGDSPTDKVIVGSDGWLFLKDSVGQSAPLDESLLERWREQLTLRHEWLAERGIHYLFVTAPAKTDIYSERLPAWQRARLPEVLRIDDFHQKLASETPARLLNLAPAIRAAAADDDLYLKLNTHWNSKGAFLAYTQIMESLGQWCPDLKPFPIEEFDFRKEEERGGDLVRMMGLDDSISELAYRWHPGSHAWCETTKHSVDAYSDEVLPDYRVPFARECARGAIRVLVIHDSYAVALTPYLSEHFARSTWVWERASFSVLKTLVEREKPDIVIEERVSRFLHLAPTME